MNEELKSIASQFGKLGQKALQNTFTTPEEKSAHFRDLQRKSVQAKLSKKKLLNNAEK